MGFFSSTLIHNWQKKPIRLTFTKNTNPKPKKPRLNILPIMDLILIPLTNIHVEWELGSSPSCKMFMHTLSQPNQGECLGNFEA
jgi:hypothetical protein